MMNCTGDSDELLSGFVSCYKLFSIVYGFLINGEWGNRSRIRLAIPHSSDNTPHIFDRAEFSMLVLDITSE